MRVLRGKNPTFAPERKNVDFFVGIRSNPPFNFVFLDRRQKMVTLSGAGSRALPGKFPNDAHDSPSSANGIMHVCNCAKGVCLANEAPNQRPTNHRFHTRWLFVAFSVDFADPSTEKTLLDLRIIRSKLHIKYFTNRSR